MKKVNKFTGFAPDVNNIYINEKNQKVKIAPSYNNLLSKVLEDSYTSVAREIIAKDENLTTLTQGNIFRRSEPYVKLYPMIYDKYQEQLIEGMKLKIKEAMNRNYNLDVNFNQITFKANPREIP